MKYTWFPRASRHLPSERSRPAHYFRNVLRYFRQTARGPIGLLSAAFLIAGLPLSNALGVEFSSPGFSIERLAGGLSLPTSIAFHTDGRIFIAQKNGEVRVLRDGNLLEAPFVTVTEVNNHRDRGLIGIELDPEFDDNGFVYLGYTYDNNPDDIGGPKTARVVRYTANGDTALGGSRRVILGTVGGSASAPSCSDQPVDADCIASDSITHTIGGLRFGPDGKLYVAVGDGANFSGIDLNAFRAQDLDNLSGKILRIEQDGRGLADNPFYTGDPDDIRSKVWAYGFRNPYRFNFHPADGRLLGGDVGWSLREEVNLVLPGNNYGWPCREGNAPSGGGYPQLQQCQQDNNFTDPIHDYPHVDTQGAVTGGSIATSNDYPSWLRNSYIFADFALGTLQYLTLDQQSNVLAVAELATDVGGPVEIVTGPDGLIYFLSISAGELYRLNYSEDLVSAPPMASATFETSNEAPLTVAFDATQSRSNDGSPLDFQWAFGDGNTAQGANATHSYQQSGIYLVTLTVTAQDNQSDSATLEIDLSDASAPDSQPQLISLTSSETTAYIGTLISFRARLSNAFDGEPFSVQFDIIRGSDGERLRRFTYDFIQIATGSEAELDFEWLPDGIGNYYLRVGFYRLNSSHSIQPAVNRIGDFKVIDRSRSLVVVGVGTTSLSAIFLLAVAISKRARHLSVRNTGVFRRPS